MPRCAKECKWPVPTDDQRVNVINILLPEINLMRQFSYLLAIEARVALYENRPIDALKSIKTGYALARHVSKGPFLVQGLVGCAIVGIMNSQLWEIMQHPDCPNLYWSLTELPSPFLDSRTMYETELAFVFSTVPDLRRIEKEKLTPEEYTILLHKFLSSISSLNQAVQGPAKKQPNDPNSKKMKETMDLMNQMLATDGIKMLYASARGKLLDAGYSTEKVNAMGPAEAILVQMLDANNFISSEILKFASLPDSELLFFNDNFNQPDFAKLETIPFASMLLPATRSARMAYARRGREFAVLRTYEAIRLHAHKHGKLPKELSEIKIVPLPNDPLTSKPLLYELLADSNGSKAKLTAFVGSSPKNPLWYSDHRYELTLANKEEVAKQLAKDKEAYKVKVATTPPKAKPEFKVYEPPKPGPGDNEPVVAKDQKYHEPNPADDKDLLAKHQTRIKISKDNIKLMMLAMHTYNDAKKTFPPAYSVDKNGKPLLSWRVLILPYIDQKAAVRSIQTRRTVG